MSDPIIRGMFDALVRRAGGVDAVASVLEARWGQGSKGTVSKMCHGSIGVTVEAAIAVEDFVGAWPITGRMFERTVAEMGRQGNIRDLAAQSAVAAGAAHAILIRAFGPKSEGGDALSRAEAADVVAAMHGLRELAGQIIAEAETAMGAA
jgi:hypothetical protein